MDAIRCAPVLREHISMAVSGGEEYSAMHPNSTPDTSAFPAVLSKMIKDGMSLDTVAAVVERMSAFSKLLISGSINEWTLCKTDDGSYMVSEDIFLAVATAKIGWNGNEFIFDLPDFRRLALAGSETAGNS